MAIQLLCGKCRQLTLYSEMVERVVGDDYVLWCPDCVKKDEKK